MYNSRKLRHTSVAFKTHFFVVLYPIESLLCKLAHQSFGTKAWFLLLLCVYMYFYAPVNENLLQMAHKTANSANIDLLGLGATFLKLLVLYKRLEYKITKSRSSNSLPRNSACLNNHATKQKISHFVP